MYHCEHMERDITHIAIENLMKTAGIGAQRTKNGEMVLTVKEELRYKGINYLEANGNVFVKEEDLLVYVDTQKPLDVDQNKGNRAFTKTGLKVLFHLLQHKDDINLTQRELA